MFDFNPTIETTTPTIAEDKDVCTTSEDDLCTTTTTGEEVRNTSDNATIDDKFTTSPTTEEEDEKSNNYYDNIDHKILRIEYEGTIVFEGDEDAEEFNTDVNTTNGNNVKVNIIEDESYISPRQRKALSNDEIAFIQQMRIENQQQEQERQKWER